MTKTKEKLVDTYETLLGGQKNDEMTQKGMIPLTMISYSSIANIWGF